MAFSPDGQKIHLILLLEIEIGRRVDDETWTQAAAPNTACYYVDCPEGEPSQVEENSVPLAVASDITECQATAGSFFYDPSTGRIYVHTTDEAMPDEGDPYLQVYHWSRHANEAYEFGGHAYRPDLDDESIPDISASIGGYHERGAEQSFGSLKILNGDGHYDSLLDTYVWEAKRFIIRAGEKNDDEADFTVCVDGWTGSISWTEDEITIETEDLQKYLL